MDLTLKPSVILCSVSGAMRDKDFAPNIRRDQFCVIRRMIVTSKLETTPGIVKVKAHSSPSPS
jgi:hypothetical protein